jgi:hypothetical protein
LCRAYITTATALVGELQGFMLGTSRELSVIYMRRQKAVIKTVIFSAKPHLSIFSGVRIGKISTTQIRQGLPNLDITRMQPSLIMASPRIRERNLTLSERSREAIKLSEAWKLGCTEANSRGNVVRVKNPRRSYTGRGLSKNPTYLAT